MDLRTRNLQPQGSLATCRECGALYAVAAGCEGVFCSLKCRAMTGSRAGHLARWGTSEPMSKQARERMKSARRRAKMRGCSVEKVEPLVVFERDGWRCHICRKSVDRRLSGRDRMGPTLDHLIPLSAGGEHSYANTALAHRSCNSSRGARGAVQLALIG